MALDRIALIVKAGDQLSVDGKKHGCPVTIIDEAAYGMSLDDIISADMLRIFGVIQIDRKMKQFLIDSMNFTKMDAFGLPLINETDFRPTTHIIDFEKLSLKCGDADIENKFLSVNSVPMVNGTGLTSEDFKDYSLISIKESPIVKDINVISSGTASVGTGKTYTNWAAAAADLAATLTGDLTFEQQADSADTSQCNFTTDLADYTFKMTSDTDHGGNYSNGWRSTFDSAANFLVFSLNTTTVDNGVHEISFLQTQSINTTSLSNRAHVVSSGDTATRREVIRYRNNMLDGNGLHQRGLVCQGNRNPHDVYNNMIWDFLLVGMTSFGSQTHRVESNSVYNCVTGLDLGSTVTAKNNVGFGNSTADFANIGSATGNNNASDDASCTNANWGTGSGNQPSLTPSNEWNSLVEGGNAAFMQPTSGQTLDGNNTTSSLVTTHIDGVTLNAIGAKGVASAGTGIRQPKLGINVPGQSINIPSWNIKTA